MQLYNCISAHFLSSVFVLLKGASKERAFEVSKQIIDRVTALNPKPVKLKFEKVRKSVPLCCEVSVVNFSTAWSLTIEEFDIIQGVPKSECVSIWNNSGHSRLKAVNTRPDFVHNFISSTTLCDRWLFWHSANRHVFCVVDNKKLLITKCRGRIFSFEMKTNRSLLLSTTVFFTTSHQQLWWHIAKFRGNDNKSSIRKSRWLDFASCVNNLEDQFRNFWKSRTCRYLSA